MSDITKIRLVASFMQFLTEELANVDKSADAKESIEVAIQCLEQAYSINPVDGTLPAKKPLLEIFASGLENTTAAQEPAKTISAEDKTRADALKNEGNNLMKANQFEQALQSYTKAIEIDDTNPIYYCNRAAAYSKVEKHEDALNDCQAAIKRDPSYSKAYCRMGLAYVNLNDPQRARDAYKKAVELDPSESNVNNLKLAEQKLAEQQQSFGQGFNLGNMLNNPALMNMASQLMSDPNMQNMFSNLVGGAGGMPGGLGGVMPGAGGGDSDGATATEAAPGGAPGAAGLESFFKVGKQLAEQMQSSNPELIEQLKSAFKNVEKDGDKKDPPEGGEGAAQ